MVGRGRFLNPLLGATLVLTGACEPSKKHNAPTHNGPKATVSAPTADGTSHGAGAAERCVRSEGDTPRRPAVTQLDPRCPDDPEGRFALRMGRVRFPDAGQVALEVELAETARQQMRGLMYRREMSDQQGMLFLFPERKIKTFWMKNTCLPLDMLFIDTDGFIVGIEENVPTMNENTYQVGCPSQFVLEVNAGWSRRHGVRPGQRMVFDGI